MKRGLLQRPAGTLAASVAQMRIFVCATSCLARIAVSPVLGARGLGVINKFCSCIRGFKLHAGH